MRSTADSVPSPGEAAVDRAASVRSAAAPAPTAQDEPLPLLLAETLERLAAAIEGRKPARGGDPETSYVARLFAKGEDAILKKIGEEATEVVMAAKDGDRARIVAETADLWFHTLIALAAHDLSPTEVIAELARREGLSGLDEKALRKIREREARDLPRVVDRSTAEKGLPP